MEFLHCFRIGFIFLDVDWEHITAVKNYSHIFIKSLAIVIFLFMLTQPGCETKRKNPFWLFICNESLKSICPLVIR